MSTEAAGVKGRSRMLLTDLPSETFGVIIHHLRLLESDHDLTLGSLWLASSGLRDLVAATVETITLRLANDHEAAALLRRFARLRTLCLSESCSLRHFEVATLAHNRTLTRLSIACAGLRTSGDIGSPKIRLSLHGVERLTQLQTLAIPRPLHAQKLELCGSLDRLTFLRSLTIGTLYTPGIKKIPALQQLTYLSLLGAEDEGEAAVAASRLSNLQRLELSFSGEEPECEEDENRVPQHVRDGLERIGGLAHLTFMSLEAESLSCPLMRRLHLPPCLQELELKGTTARSKSEDVLRLLQHRPRLRTLNITQKWLSDEPLTPGSWEHAVPALQAAGVERLLLWQIAGDPYVEKLAPFMPKLKALILNYSAPEDEVTTEGMLQLVTALECCTELSLADSGAIQGQALAKLPVPIRPLMQILNCKNMGCVEDSHLTPLTSLTALVDLRFSGNVSITNSGMNTLAKLTSLRRLRVSHTDHVTDYGVAALHTLTRLTNLRLPKCRNVTGSGLAALPNRTNLVKLKMRGTGLNAAGLSAICGCSRLVKLNAAGVLSGHVPLSALVHPNGVDSAGTKPTKHLRLKVLDVSGNSQLEDAELAVVLRGLPSLEALYINNCENLTGNGIRNLSACTSMTALCLDRCCNLSADALVALAHLKRLVTLDLSLCRNLGDAAAFVLAGVLPPSIRRLGFDGVESDNPSDEPPYIPFGAQQAPDIQLPALTDEGVQTMAARLPQLQDLSLAYHDHITDMGAAAIAAGLTELSALCLDSCQGLTPACLQSIMQLPGLARLGFASGTAGMEPAAAAVLADDYRRRHGHTVLVMTEDVSSAIMTAGGGAEG